MAGARAVRCYKTTVNFLKNAKLVGVMLDIEQRDPNLIEIPQGIEI